MSRVLVTGAASFTARHLLPLLAAEPGSTLIATDRPGIDAALAPVDLTDRDAVRSLVAEARPDLVYHLAGVLGTDEERCFAVNFGGTRHLLDACAERTPGCRIVLISSAAVYGLTRPDESPVLETTPLRPVTAYGISKAAAELAAMALHLRGRLRIKVARPFNLVGPGLGPGFAPSDFMARALALRAAGKGTIQVGALEPRRDFVDVRDAAEAYRRLGAGEDGWGLAYNVATSRPVAIRAIFNGVVRACGIQASPVEDPARRRVEVLEQVGDSSALRALTGWAPRIPLEQSLSDMVAEAR